MKLATKTLLACTAAALIGTSASAAIIVADDFSFVGDLAQNPAFATTPGNDSGQNDNFGIDKPLTISTSGFTSVGTDKLVGVITLHNSAARVSEVTSLSYGGVNVFPNIVVEDGAGNGNAFSTQLVFFLDSPTADGNLVIGLGTEHNVDEAGVALFALNNTLAGVLSVDSGNANPGTLAVSAGDFLVAAGHRNNGGITSTATPGFTDNQIVLDAGNMTAAATYWVADTDGTFGPTFSNSSSSVIAAFAAAPSAIPEPGSLLVGCVGLAGLAIRRRRNTTQPA